MGPLADLTPLARWAATPTRDPPEDTWWNHRATTRKCCHQTRPPTPAEMVSNDPFGPSDTGSKHEASASDKECGRTDRRRDGAHGPCKVPVFLPGREQRAAPADSSCGAECALTAGLLPPTLTRPRPVSLLRVPAGSCKAGKHGSSGSEAHTASSSLQERLALPTPWARLSAHRSLQH